MRKDNSEFITGFLSESGSFVRNKDYFAYAQLDDIACWVIARGVDNDQEVESAELAAKSVLGYFLQKPSISRYRIRRYLQEAHRVLQAESHRVRLKASLTIIVTDYARVRYGVAGNTRMYQFRNGRLQWQSKDQSLAQQMVDGEEIAEDALDQHEERHNLLSYLGTPNEFRPFVSKKLPLYDGDVFLLATPGLWEKVNPAEMQDGLQEAKDPEAWIDTLEDVLLSKQEHVVQNYTAAAIFANKIFKTDPQKKWRIIKRVALILLVLALAGGGALLFKMKEAERIADAATGMFEHETAGDAFIAEGDYPKALKAYSDARNAANIVKNKIQATLLAKKIRITQLIVDGDTAVKDEQYTKALDKYDKALKEMKGRDDFNESEILEKKEKTQSYVLVMQWKKEGDLLFEGQDYAGAEAYYQKARKLALETSFVTGEKELRTKLDEVASKKTGIDKEKKTLDGDKLEKQGDESYAAQDFEGAIQSYTMAQEIYQEIGVLEKVLAMERKVTKAEEKLNPPVAPASAGAPAGQPPVQGTGAGSQPPAVQVNQGAPVNQTAPINQAAPVNQTAPTNQTAPINQAVPVNPVAPMYQLVPVPPVVPTNQAAPPAATAPATQPVQPPQANPPATANPTQEEAAKTP
ncbi:serine/threonine protein phosphatase [Brevibacillus brevis]|nr:serine/threonine protein phosphatase [Brevibacillus brevis]